MRAGDLDRRIVLQRYTEAQDASGQPIRTYAPLDDGEVWAQYVPAKGTERYESGQVVVATLPALFRIRWRADVDERLQIIFGGEPWAIDGIAEIGRRDGLEISARRAEEREGNEAA